MQVVISITGVSETEARLSTLGDSLKDFTAALTVLGESLKLFFGDTNFNDEGRDLYPWAELQESTVAEKDKDWPGRGILQRSGELQSSFYDEVSPLSLYVSNNSDHFLYHQLGTSDGRGRGHNIPARPMVGVNDTVEEMIKTVIEDEVKAKIDIANGT